MHLLLPPPSPFSAPTSSHNTTCIHIVSASPKYFFRFVAQSIILDPRDDALRDAEDMLLTQRNVMKMSGKRQSTMYSQTTCVRNASWSDCRDSSENAIAKMFFTGFWFSFFINLPPLPIITITISYISTPYLHLSPPHLYMFVLIYLSEYP